MTKFEGQISFVNVLSHLFMTRLNGVVTRHTWKIYQTKILVLICVWLSSY